MDIENTKNAIKKTVNSAVSASPRSEGKLTKTVESETAKAPSLTWMGFAVGSMAISAGLQLFTPKKELGNFVGMWAPCFLLIGIYNKLVKLEGSEGRNADQARSIH